MRRSRVLLSICLAAFGGGFFVSTAPAQSPTQYIFLIDTSGSMVGLPAGSGHNVIFPKVKAELVSYLKSLRLGDIVEIRTFDRAIQSSTAFRLESENDRQRAISRVEGLDAQGQVTWVYRSILETAQAKQQEAQQPDALEIPTIFYVFTDGLDNDPENLSMVQMLQRYARLRRKDDYLIYVTLGVDLPPEDARALQNEPHVDHYDAPHNVVRIGSIQARARRLDFGFVSDEVSSPRSLALQLNNLDESEVLLRLEPRFPSVERAGGVVEVQPAAADMETSSQIRLRLINRESLHGKRFEGEIGLSTDKPHIRVIPERITAVFSTVPGPTAMVTLEDDAPSLDFGRFTLGGTGPRQISARVELNNSGIEAGGGFYLEIVPGRKGQPVPQATWKGEPVGDGLLTSKERLNELVFSWPQAPTTAETCWGEIRLLPERLTLEGEALNTDKGDPLIPYRLEVSSPPLPWWARLLLALGALLGLLLAAGAAYWALTREPPWEAVRNRLLSAGVVQPRLYGKLVYQPPDQERLELPLSGTEPIQVGAGAEIWSGLPDGFEIRANLRNDEEVVTAVRREGEMRYQSRDELTVESLSGQVLSHNDTLILSDGTEIVFTNFEGR